MSVDVVLVLRNDKKVFLQGDHKGAASHPLVIAVRDHRLTPSTRVRASELDPAMCDERGELNPFRDARVIILFYICLLSVVINTP